MTLFVAISATLKLADWTRILVENWKEWAHAFWLWAFGWLGIHLPPEWAPILSFLLFWSLLTIGQMVKFKSTAKSQPIIEKYQDTSLGPLSWRQSALVIGYLIGVVWPRWRFPEYFGSLYDDFIVGHGSVAGIGVLTLGASFSILLYPKARHRVHAAVAICLMVIFWIIITPNQLVAMKPSTDLKLNEAVVINIIAFTMMPILALLLLSVAPAKAVSRRLIFLAIGLIFLIALNALSKLGLDVTAPKLHG